MESTFESFHDPFSNTKRCMFVCVYDTIVGKRKIDREKERATLSVKGGLCNIPK